jgi:hypothetical protein
MDRAGFRALLQRLADAWQTQNTQAGLDCFTADAIYMEPPDLQLVVGHDELRPYFEALEPGTFMRWQHISFDEASQTGVGEFVFGEEGYAMADHGVCVVEVRDGRIGHWREYIRKGPADRTAFLALEGKDWKWRPD